MFSKKSKYNIFLLIIAFVLLSCLLLGGINTPKAYALDTNQKNDFFQVAILDERNDSLTANSTTNYQYSPSNSAKAYLYNVKDTYNFQFKFNFDNWTGTTPTQTIPPSGTPYYKLAIQVEYLKGYSSAYFTDDYNTPISAVDIQNPVALSTTRADYKDFKTFSPTVQIQSTNKANWGIYRFKMTLGTDIIAYSDYFILQPNMNVSNAPVLAKKDDSGIDRYEFGILITAEYKYIDENQIKWYVLGKTTNGSNYALLEEDLALTKFSSQNCDSFLYTTIDRTGYEFTLEKNDLIDGEWMIWCEYSPFGSTTIAKSEEFPFTVGNPITNIPVYWIIAGVVVLSIAITSIVVIIKIKKEKIY